MLTAAMLECRVHIQCGNALDRHISVTYSAGMLTNCVSVSSVFGPMRLSVLVEQSPSCSVLQFICVNPGVCVDCQPGNVAALQGMRYWWAL